jgi:ribosomal protein S27AE
MICFGRKESNMKDFYFDSGEDNDMCPKCGDGLIFESPSEENDYCSCWYCGGCEYIVKWACDYEGE